MDNLNAVFLDFLRCYRIKRSNLVNNEWWKWESWIKRIHDDNEYERLLLLELKFNINMLAWVNQYLDKKSIDPQQLKIFTLSLKNNKERLLSRSVFLVISIGITTSFFVLKGLGIPVSIVFLFFLIFLNLFMLLERYQVLFRSNMYQELANILDEIEKD